MTGPLSLTEADGTSNSGRCVCGPDTVTCNDVEQLFVRSDSLATASTHAP